MNFEKGNAMWTDFNDFALAELAFAYGLHDYVKFGGNLRLQNREEVETMIEEYEYNMAFPVDFNSEVEYN
jgi:hypothetical protein